jgi:hypothetical protein
MKQRMKLDHHGDTPLTAIAPPTPLAACAAVVLQAGHVKPRIKLDHHGDTPLTAIAALTPLAACAVLWGSRSVA